jgi:type I restriction enzyme, S subunit
MRTYHNYKRSGTNWVGEIPEHWIAKRLKYFAKICNGKDYREIQVEEGGFPVYGTGGIFNYASEYLYDKPSVLLGRKGTIDKPFFVNEPFWTSDTIYYTEIQTGVEPKFVYYLSRIIPFDFYTYGSAVPSMTKEHYDNMIFGYPPLQEQTSIANYLDNKTTEIDQTIADKEALINLFEEEKKALINEAVTKGLNPKIKLKPSGVDWLGDIPEHWEVKRLKYLSEIKTGEKNTEDNEVDGQYPFFVRSQTIERISTYSFDGEAILTAGDGVGVAKVFHYINGKFDYHQRVYRISHFKDVIGKYIFHYLENNLYKEVLKINAKSTVDSLRLPMFQNFMIAVPSIKEQVAIVQYIETETANINDKITLVKQEIELLKEYRQALIFEAVTGKICVL